MFLKCDYLFMYLQKWPTDKNYKKTAGLALSLVGPGTLIWFFSLAVED